MAKATRMYTTNDGKCIEILANHVNTEGGNFNGVCVSACLSYLDIKPNQYHYTWSKKVGNDCAISIMRRFGWNVRSRKTAFLKAKTISQLCKLIKAYTDYQPDTIYYVRVKGHVLLIDSNGVVVVDTAPRTNDRRTVFAVYAVFKEK